MFRNRKINTKPPQRLSTQKLMLLQNQIDTRLSRYAQLEFAKHCYENFRKAFDENNCAGGLNRYF
jgi:hypothetical protein